MHDICFNTVPRCVLYTIKKKDKECAQPRIRARKKRHSDALRAREINTRVRVESRKRKVCGTHREELGEGSVAVFLPGGADARDLEPLLESELVYTTTMHRCIDASASFLPFACRGVIS